MNGEECPDDEGSLSRLESGIQSPASSVLAAADENQRFRLMTQCPENDVTPPYHEQQDEDISGPQYVVIRTVSERVLECRNTFNRHLSVLQCYDCKIIGIGQQVSFLEECQRKWRHNHAVVLLWFPNRRQSQLWWEGMPDIKQQDWLHDGADIVIIPARPGACGAPPYGTGCIMLSDIKFSDPSYMAGPYQPNYDGAVSSRMRDDGVIVGMASTNAIDKKRGCWDPNFVTLHHFPSEEALLNFYNDESYREAKETRQSRASSDIVFFNLSPM